MEIYVDEEKYIEEHFLPIVTKLACKRVIFPKKYSGHLKNVEYSKNYFTYFGSALGTPHFLHIQLKKNKFVIFVMNFF